MTAVAAGWRCLDCRADTSSEYYMVHDELWDSVADNGKLCIGCLEGRIGRRLTPNDFMDAPINYDRWFHEFSSARIKSRLLGLSHLYLTAGDFLLKQASRNF